MTMKQIKIIDQGVRGSLKIAIDGKEIENVRSYTYGRAVESVPILRLEIIGSLDDQIEIDASGYIHTGEGGSNL